VTAALADAALVAHRCVRPLVQERLQPVGRSEVVMNPHLSTREARLPIPHHASRTFDEPDCVAVEGELGHHRIPYSLRRVVAAEQLGGRRFGE
jgi:hypothetical protein